MKNRIPKRFAAMILCSLLSFNLIACGDGQVPETGGNPTGNTPRSDISSDEIQGEQDEALALDGQQQTGQIPISAIFPDTLTQQQMNSVTMLNYLAVTSGEVCSSTSNRVTLSSTYDSLHNDLDPSVVDSTTQARIRDLTNAIDSFRMVAIKRDRLEYIFDQCQAQAMGEAIGSPTGIANSLTSGGGIAELATTVILVSVNSYADRQGLDLLGISSALQFQYLDSGWELSDEELATLHVLRQDTFDYMVTMVNANELPSDLILSQHAVDQLITRKETDSSASFVRFLENNEGTYKAYDGYWLLLAQGRFECGDYQGCLDAIRTYEAFPAHIFRLDRAYARIIPAAIASAAATMQDEEYVPYAEEHLSALLANTSPDEWDLRYFAAQAYVDLYMRNGDEGNLRTAYDLTLDNASMLVSEQLRMNNEYLSPIEDIPTPNGASKDVRDQYREYNRMRSETRKTALPPISQPLELNCRLLVALANQLDLDETDRSQADALLHAREQQLFLTQPLDELYWLGTSRISSMPEATVIFDGTKLILSAWLISENTHVTVQVNGEDVPGNWIVKKTERGTENDLSTFTATFENKDAGRSYASGDRVAVILSDGELVRYYEFVANVEERWGFLPDAVTFERT